MTAHVRTKTVRLDRRVNAARPTVGTLCGAPITDRDLTIADARKALRNNDWPVCPDCAAKLRKENTMTWKLVNANGAELRLGDTAVTRW
jgi:hypothetical protein